MFKKVSYPVSLVLVLGLVLTSSIAEAADPVGWWKCDEGSGTVVADSSGRGYDGTLSGDAEWAAGQIGGAIEFGGEGLLSVPGDCWNTAWGARPAREVTFCMWAYTENVTQTSVTVRAGPGLNLHIPWAGGIYFDIGSPVSRINRGGASDQWVSQWSHWAFTFTPGDQRIYLNGELFQSGTSSTPNPIETSAGTMLFGASGAVGQGYSGLMDDIRLYNVVLTEAEIEKVMLNIGEGFASDPIPANEATDVPRNVTLRWTSSPYDVTHNVYFGANANDVNDATVSDPLDVLRSQGQARDDTSYVISERLEFGTKYYWRVDEVNAAPDNTIFTGDVWSFTVEPLAYPIANVTATSNAPSNAGEGPVNTVNGSGLNENDEHSVAAGDMWLAVPGAEPLQIQYEFPSVLKLHEMLVWNYNVQFELMLGFGLKDVTVEYSEDGENWLVLGDVMLNQATATASYAANTTVDFGGVAAKYVRLTVNGGFGVMGQFGLSEVRFLYIPVLASEPEPADGATDVSIDAVFGWRSGREAVSHEVYLSTDEAAVVEGTALVDTVSATNYASDALELAATYYWKINEVNEAEAISTWEGQVWSFSTEEFVVIDDFESYDDEDNVIYESWIDGWINGTGSTVGYLSAPFAEETIVHGGGQSMPLAYDGTSEADLTLAGSQDWTRAGISTLTLYFRGEADNGAGQLYVKINGAKVTFDGAGGLTQLRWQQWNIDLSTVGNMSNVTQLTIGIEGSGEGLIYVDDIRLYQSAPPVAEPVDPGTDGVLLEYTFDGDASDSSGNGYHGTLIGDARVQGGVLALDGIRDAVTVPRIGGADATFGQFTISMWVYPTADLSTLEFSGGMNTDSWTAGAVHLKFHNGFLNVGINGLTGSDLEGSSIGVTNVWNHIALTVSETEIAIYLNGSREDSATLETPAEAVLGGASLGAWNNADVISREMAGEMDNVRIYDRGLSEGEVLFLVGM